MTCMMKNLQKFEPMIKFWTKTDIGGLSDSAILGARYFTQVTLTLMIYDSSPRKKVMKPLDLSSVMSQASLYLPTK